MTYVICGYLELLFKELCFRFAIYEVTAENEFRSLSSVGREAN